MRYNGAGKRLGYATRLRFCGHDGRRIATAELIKSGRLAHDPAITAHRSGIGNRGRCFWSSGASASCRQDWVKRVVSGCTKRKPLEQERHRLFAPNSPLGALLVAQLDVRQRGREVMRNGSRMWAGIVHRMERFLNSLGTIAAAAGPLLGLFGTVGMIQMAFGHPRSRHRRCQSIAGGIWQSPVCTATV